jgi:protein-S-isoprenylcysteine O-methyltransferase Ste14
MENDSPNRIPWPPIIYLGAAVVGIILGRILPLPWPEIAGLNMAGGILALAAIGWDVTSMLTFARHKANIMPNRAATKLITSGPFAWSRNPIYLGNTLLVLGAGIYFANWWLVGLAFVAAFVTQKLAIEREEAHMAAKFGVEWESYAKRVRRWF